MVCNNVYVLSALNIFRRDSGKQAGNTSLPVYELEGQGGTLTPAGREGEARSRPGMTKGLSPLGGHTLPQDTPGSPAAHLRCLAIVSRCGDKWRGWAGQLKTIKIGDRSSYCSVVRF